MNNPNAFSKNLWVQTLTAVTLIIILIFSSFPGHLIAQSGSLEAVDSSVFEKYPPLEPTNLTVTQTSLFQVSLSWNNDPYHLITGTRIERSTDPTFLEDVVDSITNTATW
ncbi:MAG: hypothetical protein ACRKGH_09505 [Dehalogenimonas sp.]